MPVAKLDVVVLGLLADEPLYGYQLLERVRERGMRAWLPVGKASVYQALARLEAGEHIAGRSVDGSEGPDRRVYRITVSGRQQLRTGLLERFDRAGPVDIPGHLSLGFLHLLSPTEARAGLARREAALAAWRGNLAAERARIAAEDLPQREPILRLLDGQDGLAKAEEALVRSFLGAAKTQR